MILYLKELFYKIFYRIKYFEIISIEEVHHHYDYVYNLEIKDNHNYFANNVLVSNCHFLKSQNAIRTGAVRDSFKNVPSKLLMTGTPIQNRLIELVSQLNILNVLNNSFGGKTRFIHKFSPPVFDGYGVKYESQNEEKLQEILRKTCMIRREKEDVLKDLPPKTKQVITLPLENYKKYEKVEIDLISWYKEKLKKNESLTDDDIRNLVMEKRKRQNPYTEKVVRMEYLKQAAVELKLPYVFEWIDNVLEQNNKLVVFAYHVDILNKLNEKYLNNSVLFHGEVNDIERQKSIDRFQNDQSINLFFGSILASGVGITLTAADKLAFIELWWNSAVHEQCEDRIHRIGQKNNVNIYYLLGEKTVEEYIYEEIILSKEKILDKSTNINRIYEKIEEKRNGKKENN